MTDALRVGQFAIVDHEPVDRGPNAGVFHGKGPHDDRAELFVVAEGTTPAGEAFAGHVVSALGQAFASLDMSLTGALRRLFLEAEQNVRDWNTRSIAQHRVSLGLSCFARRGGQAVVAQAGPTLAFHLSGRQVTMYAPDEEHARAIGTGATIPQLTRIPFEPGDRLLMISTAALAEIDDEVIGGILGLPSDQVLADLYHRLEHLRHLTAVLVTTSTPATHPGMPPRIAGGSGAEEEDGGAIIDATAFARHVGEGGGSTYQPSLFLEDEGADAIDMARRQLLELRPRKTVERSIPTTVEAAPVPLRRASGDGGIAVLLAQSHARAAHSRELTMNSVASPARRTRGGGGTAVAERPAVAEPPAAGANGDTYRKHRRDSFSRGLIREEVGGQRSPITTDARPCEELAEDTRVRNGVGLAGPVAETIAGRSAATMGGGGSLVRMRGDMGGRWKGGGGGRPATGAGQFPPTWLVILVGLGILLALVGGIVGPRALGNDKGDRYAELLDGAQQQLAAASAVPDAGKRREALTAAHAMLLEADEVDSAALANTGLVAEVEAELAAMDNVRTPQLVERISSLEQFGDEPVSITRLVVGDTQAYLLDSKGAQVIGVTFATGEKQVLYQANKEGLRGLPVALAYVDRSDFSGAAVVIADDARSLWAHGSEGLEPLAFAPPSGLTVTDIAIYNGDLYVLDAQAAVVYRFTQGPQGYGNAPSKLLETPDLAAARRLMVDGEIVTGDADGTLRRFTNQVSLVLSQAGIDKPLVKEDVAQPVEARGDLAVLDAPNDRIVVFRRDGTFDRQFKHKDLHGMTAFSIRNSVAYVFAGGWLRRVTW